RAAARPECLWLGAWRQATAATRAADAWTMLLVSSVTLLPPTPSTTQTRNRTVSADEATTTRRKFRSSPRFLALTVTVSSRWPHVSASWAVAVQRRTGARRVQTIHEQTATLT